MGSASPTTSVQMLAREISVSRMVFPPRRRLSLNRASLPGKKSTLIAPQQQNATTIYIPVGPMGVPIVGNLGLSGHEPGSRAPAPGK
jgi:hypothetical protein